jgi:hypothetical protein
MITESQQRGIRRECESIIDHCQQALEHAIRLTAAVNDEHIQLPELIAEKLRLALFQAKILLEFKGKKAAECQPEK